MGLQETQAPHTSFLLYFFLTVCHCSRLQPALPPDKSRLLSSPHTYPSGSNARHEYHHHHHRHLLSVQENIISHAQQAWTSLPSPSRCSVCKSWFFIAIVSSWIPPALKSSKFRRHRATCRIPMHTLKFWKIKKTRKKTPTSSSDFECETCALPPFSSSIKPNDHNAGKPLKYLKKSSKPSPKPSDHSSPPHQTVHVRLSDDIIPMIHRIFLPFPKNPYYTRSTFPSFFVNNSKSVVNCPP